jgi:hypothetical protein
MTNLSVQLFERAPKDPHDPEGDDHPGFDIPPAWPGYVRSPAEEGKYWFICHRHIARVANDIYLSAGWAALGMPKLSCMTLWTMDLEQCMSLTMRW